MKKIAFILLMIFVFVLYADAQKTYALLTGVSNYQTDGVTNLANTTKDVKELQTLLKRQGAIVSVLTGKYANVANVMKKLDAINKMATSKDNIIFFFSGHGTTGGMAVYGPQILTYETLNSKLSKAKTKNVFCFVDACYSGSVSDKVVSDKGQPLGNKIVFMMASRSDEYSQENQWLGNGYFSQALLKGVRGKADVNRDRKVTVLELYKYIYADVVARTKKSKYPQHPQLIGPKGNFEIVLAKW